MARTPLNVVKKLDSEPAKPTPTELAQQSAGRISHYQSLRARANSSAKQRRSAEEFKKLFTPAIPPPGVLPQGVDAKKLAMDEWGWSDAAFSSFLGQPGANYYASSYAEGQQFLGYGVLAVLAQRAEYRVITETLASDMTREWIRFEASKEAKEDKTEKIAELENFLDHLKLKDVTKSAIENDGFQGRGQIYIDLGVDINEVGTSNPETSELRTSIGNGRDETSKAKVKKGSLERLVSIEPMWTYPYQYNASQPLRKDWYNPTTWFVMGTEVHRTRLITFIGRPVPDLLKPAYSFGGLSMTQMAKPYVDFWLRDRTSASDLLNGFSTMVLMTTLDTSTMSMASGNELYERIETFNALRDNMGLLVLNKATEDFKNVSASLSGLHELVAQAQEHIASVAQIPTVKLLGIQPAGLNADSEGVIRLYYDRIKAFQESLLRKPVGTIIDLAQISLWGEVDEEITFVFKDLWQLDEAGKGAIQLTRAQIIETDIASGIISPEEGRIARASDPESPYQGLNLEEGEAPGQQMEQEQLEGGGGGEGGLINPEDQPDIAQREEKAVESQAANFGGGASAGLPAHDAWTEEARRKSLETRRANKAAGSGGGASSLQLSGMKKIGSQLGSNPGGKYEDSSGKKYYVKLSKSNDHAKNEILASRLYEAAGSPILHAKEVDMGNGKLGTATEWKDNVSLIKRNNDEQKKAAQENFATHAWLANWDAAGLEYDNQGMVDGKMTTLDPGGSLLYRAQGGPKGSAFGDKANEWESLRDPSNHQANQIFGSMTDEQLRKSAEKVTSIPDSRIKQLVYEFGPGDDAAQNALANKLIARRDDIARRAKQLAHDAAMMGEDKSKWDETLHPRDEAGKFTAKGGAHSGMVSMLKNAGFAKHPESTTQTELYHHPSGHSVGFTGQAGKGTVNNEFAQYLNNKFVKTGYGNKQLQAILDEAKKTGVKPSETSAAALAMQFPQPNNSDFQKTLLKYAKEGNVNKLKELVEAYPGTKSAAYGNQLLAVLNAGATQTTNLPSPGNTTSPILLKMYELAKNGNKLALETEIAGAVLEGKSGAVEYGQSLMEAMGGKSLTPAPKAELPEPNPNSQNQKTLYELAQGNDVAKIVKAVKAHAEKYGENSFTWKYAQQLLTAIGQPNALKEQTKSAPTSSSEQGQHGAIVAQAPKDTARYKAAKKLADDAEKPNEAGKGKNAVSNEICPSLTKTFWSKIPSKAKEALSEYWDGMYGSINNALRQKDPGKVNSDIQEIINKIDNLFYEEGAQLQKDVRLTRGVNVPDSKINEWISQLKAGVPCSAQKTGFVSASMAPRPAFADKNTWFIMTCKKGTPALGVDTLSVHSENEILLQHGQAFNIYQIEQKNGRNYVYMVTP